MLTLHASCWVAVGQAPMLWPQESCLLWDPALPQWGWVPLKRKAWEEVSMFKLSLQEAGGWCWHGGPASGKLFWQTPLYLYFFFPSPRSGAFTVLRAILVIQGREEGLCSPIQQRSWETHGFPARHSWEWVSFIPCWIQCQPSTARTAGTCLDTFGIQVFILIAWLCLDLCLWFFLFLEAEWISPGLCNCCTTFWLCVVQGSAVVSGDMPLKYSYYLSSLHKLHQISTRHFQKLLLIGQLRLQS